MDYHILTQALDRSTASVVFHIPIPASNNSAGISWRTAVVSEQGGAASIVSVLPELVGTQEETDLKAGELFELSTVVRFESVNLTNGQRLSAIEAAFTEAVTSLVAEKQITLDFMGKKGDV